MTSLSFCKWVNEELLPNRVLEPGYPRKIGLETARKWFHHLEFHVLDQKKGVYIDGHEREDVTEYRQKFLRLLVSLTKTMHLLQNDNSCLMTWNALHLRGQWYFSMMSLFLQLMKIKNYSGVVLICMSFAQKVKEQSDFIDESNGYLRLTDDEV